MESLALSEVERVDDIFGYDKLVAADNWVAHASHTQWRSGSPIGRTRPLATWDFGALAENPEI